MAELRHGKKWDREETLAAFNYYFCIPFAKMTKGNPSIIRIAEIMRRTPSSVSMKLCNIASGDPEIMEKGHKGLKNAAANIAELWAEFHKNPEVIIRESERIAAEMEKSAPTNREQIITEAVHIPEGRERTRVVKERINQSFFRRMVMSAYKYRCCVTGLAVPGLLNASHIIPWSKNKREGLNPRNGLCLNILHHRAFDLGMMTILPSGVIKVSSDLRDAARKSKRAAYVAECDGNRIETPNEFPPSREFLTYHNKEIFNKASPRLAI